MPEASDRQELQYPFGTMEQFPTALPVSARGEWLQGWPLIPWLAARTTKVRIGMSITDTPYRAPGVLAAETATIDHLSHGRVNVGVGSGWMPEEFAAASAAHIFPKRHKHVRETIEVMQGIWTNDLFEYHGEFADFDRCGFGAKPVQQPHPPIFCSGLKDPKRSASRIAKYNHRRGDRSDTEPQAQQPAGRDLGADHRQPQALQGSGDDDAAPLAAVRRCAGVEDARRPEASEGRDHAQGRRHLTPHHRNP